LCYVGPFGEAHFRYQKTFKKIHNIYYIKDDYTIIQVLVTLIFLATGSYQPPIVNNRFTTVSQPTVSRCISEVVAAINHPEIFHKWVKFPKDLNELTEVWNELLMFIFILEI